MEEELAAPSTSADKTDSMDVDGEAKKLLGLGQKHLVLGNIPAAVNAFQEAASILGKKYGETADECAEAFFYYGKSLLELARMENGVLGNALEGVQVEEEEGEKAEDDSMVENADNIDEEAREELREQVYNAMGEKEESKKSAEESPVLNEAGKETEGEDVEMGGKTREEEAIADVETKLKEKAEEQVEADMQEKTPTEERVEAATEEEAVAEAMEEKLNKSKEALASKETLFAAGNATTPAEGKEPANEIETEEKVEVAVKVEKERDDLMEEGDGAKVEKEEEKDDLMEEGEETEGSDEEDKENDKTEDNKENDSTVEDKVYGFSVVENYAQAIEEFQACLALQQKYLEAHDRLLAESHYQLALAYHYNSQFDDAILQFRKSVEVIDKRMVMLTERIKKAEGGSTEDEKEIEELNGLLPEIKEKIEDSKESQKSARVAELALKATLVGGATSSFTQSEESCSISTIPVRKPADGASQCVTDISHLVRKKRKPEEETQQGDNEPKKSKPEPAVNGGGDAAPSGNEVAEKMEEEETEKRPQVESGAAVESTV
ncbi:Nuclear autoantigenic sperm protein [Chelonia mydas]|uniref:Nuclear autoantigenic sperm protein n=1 Tax=Chelonia mydas TaxID=8469 RepID=M7BA94_CHEMY|nr:Nuclear autoantigenic sperm protein [Chelonia mydas]